jgi:VWFA-related protein
MKRAALAAALVLGTIAPAADPPENPRDVGLVERASTRLAQIDVTVTGAKGAIEGLTAADFEVRLNDKIVPRLLMDDLCHARPVPGAAAPPAAERQDGTAAVPPPETQRSTSATYLLYFDMSHLTQSGRQGAIASAREMIPKLLGGGQRATLVANAAELKTLVPLTADVAVLDAALAKLVDDQATFEPFAATEENRLNEIIREMSRGTYFALALARRYAADERWRQERDLRRLSMVLGRLGELDPPKAALYFADTMRQNAGEHYLSFFSDTTTLDANGKPGADASAILMDAATGVLPLDKVINEAASMGIRFYTIEGQGMTGPTSFIQSRSSPSNSGGGGGGNQASSVISTQRTRDAQNTLVSLAAETGGRAFLNGVSPAKMSAQILDDMSCLYLLSFDPSGFPQDKPLAVAVAVNRPKVKTSVRGRLVIQSDAARLTGRVLSAFAAPVVGTGNDGSAVRIGLIPIAYTDGAFKARVQVALAGSAVPSATWDIGASLVSKGVVWQDGSGRIQVVLPNTPVVFEKDMDFAPGDYDLVVVAHETQTDTILSKEAHGTWPKIDADLATLSPIAVSQRRAGGFLRNGEKQTQGAVVVAPDELLRPDAPTAVITLVCRAKDQKRPLDVKRTLVGEQETPVGTTKLDAGAERCAQVLDLIPPKMLGAGRYRYLITVSSDGRELTRGERALVVPEPAPAAVPAPEPDPAKSGS